MHFGFHHHIRLRRHQRSHSSILKILFDRAAYIAGVMIAIMTAPQIWQIYTTQNATGVSLFTWLMYGLGSVFWVGYGIVHKEKPIVFTNVVASTLQLIVALGVVLYSK